MITFVLWFVFTLFVLQWVFTFIFIFSRKEYYIQWILNNCKFKYGITDVLGVLALIGLIIKYWGD